LVTTRRARPVWPLTVRPGSGNDKAAWAEAHKESGMADDQVTRSPAHAGWTKIFAAFKVALDLKKLLLAAAGILVTAAGWWCFSWLFYTESTPQPEAYLTGAADKKEAWTEFKQARERWNLLHEMAGPPGAAVREDAADIASTYEEYEELLYIKTANAKFRELVELKLDENSFVVDGKKIVVNKNDLPSLTKLTGVAITIGQVVILDEAQQTVAVAGVPVKVDSDIKPLKEVLAQTKSLEQLRIEVATKDSERRQHAERALDHYTRRFAVPALKPSGRLRTWPFTEERGPNQYLLVEGLLRKEAEGRRTVPWDRGQFLNWLVSDQLPVLIEPLMKFLAPIGYFFNADATGFRNRLLLIIIILWTVATWAFFGGAICRIAAVQIAKNERVSLRESVHFAKDKFLNLFTAPIFPLIFLLVLTVFLIIFGWLIGFTFQLGDLVLTPILFPIVLVFGLIMAVVLVGLIGWPLMNPTIAAEGSDNFDALSRSYSYVYQAIWHYLWYWLVAIIYGAALIFFVGFMGSLVVYMGKWGLSQAPGLQKMDVTRDRDPAYLFHYTPTSFGWRNLLIKDSPHVIERPVISSSGVPTVRYEFKQEYMDSMSVANRIAATFVALWVGLFFLLIVGFGYSFFWTAATIIYFLVRKYVDDTELDEVYFEEGELEPPGSTMPAATPAATAAPGEKPNTLSLNVVDPGAPPAPPTASPAPAPPVEPPPPPPPPPEPAPPVITATAVDPTPAPEPAPEPAPPSADGDGSPPEQRS
jgi:hypothetical protein